MTELKQDVKLAVTKFTAQEKATLAAKEQEVKGWWLSHRVVIWGGIALITLGFGLGKLV